MDKSPLTIAELKDWLRSRRLDPKVFAVDGEPDWEGYYVVEGPPQWKILVKTWPAGGFVVRTDNEADLCRCYVELVNGTECDKGSLTRRIRDEIKARVERSWKIDQIEEQQS